MPKTIEGLAERVRKVFPDAVLRALPDPHGSPDCIRIELSVLVLDGHQQHRDTVVIPKAVFATMSETVVEGLIGNIARSIFAKSRELRSLH